MLKSVGNPIELFRSMYRWHDLLVDLGKLADGQLVANECGGS